MAIGLGLVIVLTAATSVLAAGPSTAPARQGDFPDPWLLRVGLTYHAYATQSGAANVQTMSSADLIHWGPVTDALPQLPKWEACCHTWAPSVLGFEGTYVLFYAARDRGSGRQCVSDATSNVATGPFVDLSRTPLVCQLDRGGSIDPNAFLDAAGTPYLVWKSEDNALGRPATLWSQQLSPNGRTLVGRRVALLQMTAGWEHPTIEGPTMVAVGATWYLFYGAGDWDTQNAAIGYATCASPLGPCIKATTTGPWLATRANRAGPSGPAVFSDATGATWIAYHAWAPGRVGYEHGGVRSLWLDRLSFTRDGPVVGDGGEVGPLRLPASPAPA